MAKLSTNDFCATERQILPNPKCRKSIFETRAASASTRFGKVQTETFLNASIGAGKEKWKRKQFCGAALQLGLAIWNKFACFRGSRARKENYVNTGLGNIDKLRFEVSRVREVLKQPVHLWHTWRNTQCSLGMAFLLEMIKLLSWGL